MTDTPTAIARNACSTVPLNPFLLATFRTLSKHHANGAFDNYAALRLLRNNVRDIAPRDAQLTQRDRNDIAERLLRYWRYEWCT
jgi:hypothetical protein